MNRYHIRIVNGWCGNRMLIVRDHLKDLLEQRGYSIKIDNQSIWENSSPPEYANLVFQLIPAFQPDELPCPSLHIRPLLKDLDDPETLEKVFQIVEQYYPVTLQP